MPYAPEDIFVLLPGILGSVLAIDNKEVWGPSAGAIFKALKSRGETVSALQIRGKDDPTLDDLGDKVTATRLIPDVTLVPGFWKIDGYTTIAESIISNFNLVRGESFFEFPYDWRRHNAVAARKLQRNVHDWLSARKYQRGGDPKVILLAHSMGGLVSRYFLEVLGGWQQTRALFTFGTPFRGSLNALGYLANGYKVAGMEMTSLLRTLSSVYELLPIYPCVVNGNSAPSRVAETTGLPNVDHDRAGDALAFHRKIEDQQKLNSTLPGYGYQIVPLVGFEQPTMQSAQFDGKCVTLLASRGGVDESGDGTVPRVSATPIEMEKEVGAVFAPERHACLQNNESLLAQVRAVLTRPDTGGVLRDAQVQISLSATLEDAYEQGQEIEIGVKASNGVPDLHAVLKDALTNVEIAALPLRRGGPCGQRVIFDPVPTGHYRFTVSGDDVSPVSDVFLVA
jgi:pimeloyl-ACP methyl ester carboxylesterase